MRDEPDIHGASPAIGLASAMLTAGQLPFMVSLAWWHASLGLMHLAMPHPHVTPHHDAEGQLVVPEPIEDDGEHALFA